MEKYESQNSQTPKNISIRFLGFRSLYNSKFTIFARNKTNSFVRGYI